MGCMKQLHEHLERVSYRNLGVRMLGARGMRSLKRYELEEMLANLSAYQLPEPSDIMEGISWSYTGNVALWQSLYQGGKLPAEDFRIAARAVRALIEIMEEEDEHD